MNIDWSIAVPSLTIIIGIFLGAFLNKWQEKKTNLITYIGHIADFTVEDYIIFTHSIVISNSGSLPANNVRIHHKNLPKLVQIKPSTNFKIEELNDGTKNILIEKIIAGESISVSYLYKSEETDHNVPISIKSDEGYAKHINMLPQQQYSKKVQNFAAFLILLGSIATLYFIFKLIFWIIKLIQMTS